MEPTDAVLEWHLQRNHHPSVPVQMVQPAREAIEAVQQDDPNRLIALNPEHTYVQWSTAAEIVENLHLDDFLS